MLSVSATTMVGRSFVLVLMKRSAPEVLTVVDVGANNAGFLPMRDLGRSAADGTGRTGNQHRFAGPDPARDHERRPSRDVGNPNGRCLIH